MFEIGLGIVLFTAIVLALVGVVLAFRTMLVSTGEVQIIVNDREPLRAPVGLRLLDVLAESGIQLPSACGGKGTCGQCRVTVQAGGDAIRQIELASLAKREVRAGMRLACQVPVKRDIAVRVPDEMLDIKRFECTVHSNRNVATMIRELVFELPLAEGLNFQAGSYVQVVAPPFSIRFADFDIDADYRDEWDRLDLWRHRLTSNTEETRAYSMANYPEEKHMILLNVRIAIPPPGAAEDVPPGIVSSYLFSLKPGDKITVSGPYGHFFATDTQTEMVFIGGGAGMAPMRAHIMDQLKRLKSRRKITFWYGARSRRELFYVNDFDTLQVEHDNFRWFIALSDAKADDNWAGRTGFIHDVVYEDYLKDHPSPEDCEYYICGPPMMLQAVLAMLDNLGVGADNIFYDDFGG